MVTPPSSVAVATTAVVPTRKSLPLAGEVVAVGVESHVSVAVTLNDTGVLQFAVSLRRLLDELWSPYRICHPLNIEYP